MKTALFVLAVILAVAAKEKKSLDKVFGKAMTGKVDLSTLKRAVGPQNGMCERLNKMWHGYVSYALDSRDLIDEGQIRWTQKWQNKTVDHGKTDRVTNTCAVRASIGLYHAGVDFLKDGSGRALTGKGGRRIEKFFVDVKKLQGPFLGGILSATTPGDVMAAGHAADAAPVAIRVDDFRAVLNKQFGAPLVVTHSAGRNGSSAGVGFRYVEQGVQGSFCQNLFFEPPEIWGRAGVIVYSQCDFRGGATGHIDVWDGSKVRSRGYPEKCKKVELFNVCGGPSRSSWPLNRNLASVHRGASADETLGHGGDVCVHEKQSARLYQESLCTIYEHFRASITTLTKPRYCDGTDPSGDYADPDTVARSQEYFDVDPNHCVPCKIVAQAVDLAIRIKKDSTYVTPAASMLSNEV